MTTFTTLDHDAITIRQAYPDDAAALARLALLDATELPAQPYLVAEIDGELVAARGLDTGATAADPFVATSGVLALLEVHARRLERGEQRRRKPLLASLADAMRTQPAR